MVGARMESWTRFSNKVLEWIEGGCVEDREVLGCRK